ncbi:hypothetical protein GCM10007028_02700 [Algibacter mikhailovii]|uniref:Uncharacterized protein n=1 Tax=Algibacter mikhailovii TaxID=425498 RepID=A0A918QUM0_9FLAO|nr:hypothetical protein GCM10007028_02700 [Algibacter mikhailovii]
MARLFNITIKKTTVTINQLNIKTMRTLNNNQLTNALEGSKTSQWNTKRRFR